MSPLLLHVLAHSPWQGGPLAEVVGLRGQPLRWIEAGPVGTWATVWDAGGGAETPLAREDLLASHILTVAAWNAAPCLPVRLPTWLPDEAAVIQVLAAQAPAIKQRIEEVGRHAELAVTALWKEDVAAPAGSPQPPAPDAPPGRRYMEARRAKWHRRDTCEAAARALASELERALAPWLRAAQSTYTPRSGVAFTAALLITRAGASESAARARATMAAWHGVRAVVSGPWPPYSFASLDAAATAEASSLSLPARSGALLAVSGNAAAAAMGAESGRASG